MSDTPRTDQHDNLINGVVDADFARELERENARLREALEDIRTTAHCLAKAGPLATPDFFAAWGRFMKIDAKASAALHANS